MGRGHATSYDDFVTNVFLSRRQLLGTSAGFKVEFESSLHSDLLRGAAVAKYKNTIGDVERYFSA